jgi:chaperonin GroES
VDRGDLDREARRAADRPQRAEPRAAARGGRDPRPAPLHQRELGGGVALDVVHDVNGHGMKSRTGDGRIRPCHQANRTRGTSIAGWGKPHPGVRPSARLSSPGMPDFLRPLFDQVVIKELEPDRMRKSGLLVPEGTHDVPPNEGIVLAVGDGPPDLPDFKMPLRPGDHVVFPRSAGVWVEVEDERLLVCRVREILGVIESAPAPADASERLHAGAAHDAAAGGLVDHLGVAISDAAGAPGDERADARQRGEARERRGQDEERQRTEHERRGEVPAGLDPHHFFFPLRKRGNGTGPRVKIVWP